MNGPLNTMFLVNPLGSATGVRPFFIVCRFGVDKPSLK